jgi:hypothetical protein
METLFMMVAALVVAQELIENVRSQKCGMS